MRKKIYVVVLLSLMLLGSSCNIEDKDAPINEYGYIDLNKVPYNKLSDYRFFTGAMNELNPAQGVYPYDLTASLFSDYAAKERLIYLPEGTTMEYQGDFKVLEFPIGTIIIKNFIYYEDVRDKSLGRTILETRLLVRKETKWKPFAYKWNDEQTEATRLIVGGTATASTIIENGTLKEIERYVIPRELDCRTCHNLNEEMTPIGPKPANLYMMMKDELSRTNEITVYANGERVSNFIHKDLLINKVLFFIENDCNGIFNIGDKNLTYKEFADYVISQFGDMNSKIIIHSDGVKSKLYIKMDKFNCLENQC